MRAYQVSGAGASALGERLATTRLDIQRQARLCLTLIFIIVAGLGCEAAPATHYDPPLDAAWYVGPDGADSNDGTTRLRPFRSIDQAARRARPGDVVMVLEGTYEGPVTTRASGRDGAPIIYVSETPLGARIDGRGAYSAWENYGDYVEIVGFEVLGSDYLGIVSWGSHVTIRNNWVHDLSVPSCNEPNGGAGINHADYGSHDNVTMGNIVSRVRAPPECTRLVHGIYHSNHGGVIANNLVFDVTFAGIQTWHSANEVTIANNLVMGARVGIIVARTGGPADGFVVSNNILVGNGVGIEESGFTYGDNNRYISNLLFDNGTDLRVRSSTAIGTIRADPVFVAGNSASPDGDFRLRDGSPAIDAGSADGAPDIDFHGVTRPQGATVDIGPFEWCEGGCRHGEREARGSRSDQLGSAHNLASGTR